MATRRPIVLVNGRKQELPIGDTLPPGAIPGGGGAGGASGAATITLTDGSGVLEWTQTVAAPGVAIGNAILITLAEHLDSDENDPEMLNIDSMVAVATAADQLRVTLTFGEPTSGPIKLIWKVL